MEALAKARTISPQEIASNIQYGCRKWGNLCTCFLKCSRTGIEIMKKYTDRKVEGKKRGMNMERRTAGMEIKKP